MATDAQGTEAIEVDKLGLLDGRISLMLPDGRTQFAVWGTNLLNRSYFNNGISFADSFGYALRYYAPPRLYGVEVSRSF
jgi:outer membrane receptor protein involved in Fe transport